jgi:septum formation protein
MRTVVPEFEVIPACIDESQHRRRHPTALTMATAMAKGRALAERITDPAIIITADTVVRMADGTIREKPQSEAEVRQWLRSYERSHPCAVTAVYGIRTTDRLDMIATDAATVAFRPFSRERIAAIIADGTAMTCSGAFTMEHPLFADHIEKVWGNPQTIQGLPSALVKSFVWTLSRT